MRMEDHAIHYFDNLIHSSFTVKKTWEGCLCDITIKPNNIDIDNWLPIQVKTTLKPSKDYGFKYDSKYTNCLILCLCLSDKKMWLMKANDIHVNKKITIGLHKSKYDKYFVSKENIIETLFSFYNNMLLFNFEKLDTPISIQQQKEKEYVKFSEKKCCFLNFEYPLLSGLVYDFTINGFCVQEKVGTIRKNRKDQIIFSLQKSNGTLEGKRIFQSYKINDNDFYWLNFPDKKYFYILPENILFFEGFINENSKTGSSSSSYKKHITINTKNIDHIKFKDFLFDYENIDINKLKGLFGML
jgi:hypothetical protein